MSAANRKAKTVKKKNTPTTADMIRAAQEDGEGAVISAASAASVLSIVGGAVAPSVLSAICDISVVSAVR